MSRTPSSAVGLREGPFSLVGTPLSYSLTHSHPFTPTSLFSRYVLSIHTCPEPLAWRSGVEGIDKGPWLLVRQRNRPHSGKDPPSGLNFPILLLRSPPSQGLAQAVPGASGLPTILVRTLPACPSPEQPAPFQVVPKSPDWMWSMVAPAEPES